MAPPETAEPPRFSCLGLLCWFGLVEDAVDRAATDPGQRVDAVDAEAGGMGLADEWVAPLMHFAPSGQGAFSLLGAQRHSPKSYM